MYREGHLGAALAAYAPVAFVALLAGAAEVALLGAAVPVGLATLPDYDTRVPFVTHRGYSHTVWFALLVGIACGAGGALIGRSTAPAVPLGALGFVAGTLTICSHIAADALTPAGVKPFAPFGGRYSLDLVTASNRAANVALLVLGAGALLAALALGSGAPYW